jgi:cytoskeletal protein CcmA (bactofilin family)
MDFSGNNSAQGKQSIVEEGSEFRGTLSSSCAIIVRGRIEGDIEAPALTVSKSGAVHGRVRVGQVRSEGELSGEFDAESIQLAGTVRDNTVIRAKTMEVKLSSDSGKMQVIFGECELAVGETPADETRRGGRKRRERSEAPVATPVEAETPTEV